MSKKFSEESKEIIKTTKKLAERFGNNYIGTCHFFLCFNKFNKNGRLQLNITFKEKKDCIKYLKDDKGDNVDGKDFLLTIPMEKALKYSSFHCMIMGDNLVEPEHIFLGIFTYDGDNKQDYINLLKQNNIVLSKLKLLIIDFYFNKFWRKTGIVKLIFQK